MLLDDLLPLARTRQGLADTDTTHDASINLCLSLALAVVETYLDRKLGYLEDDKHIVYAGNYDALVRRYPIESVKSITNHSGAIRFDARRGLVYVGACAQDMEIVYTGGYKLADLPQELLFVIWKLFDDHAGDFGLPVAKISAGGTIQSITVPDVGQIRYSDAGSSAAGDAQGLLSAMMRGVLDRFRAESAVGAG